METEKLTISLLESGAGDGNRNPSPKLGKAYTNPGSCLRIHRKLGRAVPFGIRQTKKRRSQLIGASRVPPNGSEALSVFMVSLLERQIQLLVDRKDGRRAKGRLVQPFANPDSAPRGGSRCGPGSALQLFAESMACFAIRRRIRRRREARTGGECLCSGRGADSSSDRDLEWNQRTTWCEAGPRHHHSSRAAWYSEPTPHSRSDISPQHRFEPDFSDVLRYLLAREPWIAIPQCPEVAYPRMHKTPRVTCLRLDPYGIRSLEARAD
jgi:hypothetical protein